MSKMIYKDFAVSIKEVDESQNIIRAVFSTPIEDRQGEIIDQTGWLLDEYLKNPVVLFGHDHFQPAIGKVVDIAVLNGNLEGAIQFAANEYDFARTIYNLYKGGFMKAFSVGYQNLEAEENEDGTMVHKKNTLYEISCVNVPANALALAKSKGIDVSSLENKSVVPYHGFPMADEDMEWSGEEAEMRMRKFCGGPDKMDMDFSKYKEGFAWFDETDKENLRAYKMPHHDIVDGEMKTIWRGVAAAMAALMGARGGVDVPDADREKIYNHLAKHYKQFEKEPPEFKSYTEEEIKQMFSEIQKYGKVLSAKNRKTIENAKSALEDVLSADEERSDDTRGVGANGRKPLASQGIKKRIVIRTINKAVRSLLNNKLELQK